MGFLKGDARSLDSGLDGADSFPDNSLHYHGLCTVLGALEACPYMIYPQKGCGCSHTYLDCF